MNFESLENKGYDEKTMISLKLQLLKNELATTKPMEHFSESENAAMAAKKEELEKEISDVEKQLGELE